MKHQLKLEVKNQSVAVERFLRVVRHRGFSLLNLQLEPNDDKYFVNMTVDSNRPVYLLTQQLEKLLDVVQVQLLAAEHQQAV
jgi:acetolactate synthase II small subunit